LRIRSGSAPDCERSLIGGLLAGWSQWVVEAQGAARANGIQGFPHSRRTLSMRNAQNGAPRQRADLHGLFPLSMAQPGVSQGTRRAGVQVGKVIAGPTRYFFFAVICCGYVPAHLHLARSHQRIDLQNTSACCFTTTIQQVDKCRHHSFDVTQTVQTQEGQCINYD
jgi:hypothetical protein